MRKSRFLGFVCLVTLLSVAAGCAPQRSNGAPSARPPSATVTSSKTATPAPTAVPSLALVNGTLLDGTGSEPLADAAVVVQGNRITQAGPRARVTIPTGARVIDLGGAAILPGFTNAHVHEGYDPDHLRAWAQAGVTTVRDLSPQTIDPDTLRSHYALRDRTWSDPHLARIVSSSPMMSAPGGYGRLYVASPEDARQKAGAALDLGANLIKIAIEDDLPPGRRHPLLPQAEARAIVEVAHQRGVPVSVHVSQPRHVELALDAGVDDLAHMAVDELPAALISRTVAAGTYWVPTLELWSGVGWGKQTTANLRRFVAAGGKVALGTDYAGYAIKFDLGMPIHEVQYMQEAGMTPMQIIVAATRNAAHVCNREQDLGTLEAGKLADILVVNGDPLTDLQALLKVRLVIKDGTVIRE